MYFAVSWELGCYFSACSTQVTLPSCSLPEWRCGLACLSVNICLSIFFSLIHYLFVVPRWPPVVLAPLWFDHSFALKQAVSTNVSLCKPEWPCRGDWAHQANADAPLRLHNPACSFFLHIPSLTQVAQGTVAMLRVKAVFCRNFFSS